MSESRWIACGVPHKTMHTQQNPPRPTPHDAKHPLIVKYRVWLIAFWIVLALGWLVLLRLDFQEHDPNSRHYIGVAAGLLVCAVNIFLVQLLASRPK